MKKHINSVLDIRRMNSQAVFADHTGMIILGGGLVKHHICNANLMVSHFTLLQPILYTLLDRTFFYKFKNVLSYLSN